jgi:YVTN family beta-propeller protein
MRLGQQAPKFSGWIAIPISVAGLLMLANASVTPRNGQLSLFANAAAASANPATAPAPTGALPGMPPVLNANDIYAADRPGQLSPAVKNALPRIYIPNSDSNSVDVIDPATFKIVDHFAVGRQPQHVTPSYDLKTLWVLNDLGNSLTRIDPFTAKAGETIPVEDPYNMYYTPDGKYAIVVAEARKRLDFRNPETMKLEYSVPVPCRGVDHMDFTADGRYLIASCEFSAEMLKVDVAKREIVGTLMLHKQPTSSAHAGHVEIFNPEGMPQDVKTSPDGKVFYVADMAANGVYLIEPDSLKILNFLPTGTGAHGLYVSRDSKVLYVSNRGEGSVTLIDLPTRKIAGKWKLPGGSPDMGGVSADGKVLWLSGRYNAEVYAIDTSDGRLLARIPVGRGPHGLCVYPQPGRYSLGHTGVFR